MRNHRWMWLVAAGLWVGCGDGGGGTDAGNEADGDTLEEADGDGGVEMVGSLRFDPPFLSLLPGESRTVRLWVQHPPGADIEIALAAGTAGVADLPATATLPTDAWSVAFEVEGTAAGTTEVTASYGARTAVMTVDVTAPGIACDGSGGGNLAPGDRVAGTGGLAEAWVEMPPDDTLDPVEVALACAEDIVPDGYTALGPAVSFGPLRRYRRELRFSIPVKPALLPPRLRFGDVVVFYTDGHAPVREVSFASPWIEGTPGGGRYRFASPRLGTFQAAYQTDAGTRSRTRRYTYRGITGVSMGGGGAALVGLRNPDAFDFVAPLGGPANWSHMLDYVNTYHLGGFCTVSPRDEGDPGEYCLVPPAREVFEITQTFEYWHYTDGHDGQGGTFDRREYCQIFRDMSLSIGNPGSYNPDSPYLPPGVPRSWWELPAAERCANPYVLPAYYDDEYNADGTYSAITFCDGAEVPGDVGRWDPTGRNDYPLDVGVAIDLDGDTIRDPGEPVVRSGHEPYDDVGVDGVASELEAGYDPESRWDPAGDDFDYQFNPTGSEGNRRWDGAAGGDPGEPWVDAGLDGVPGTPQTDEDGYDWGEGNGEFDWSPNYLNYLEHDGYELLRTMADEDLDRIDVLADGGIRDLFQFAPGENLMMAALAERGRPARFYNDFGALWGVSGVDEQIDPREVDFLALGRNTMIRYGDPDADITSLQRGDGGHVGTVNQVLNRLAYVTFAMSARWPGGDRAATATDTANTMLSFDFTSPSTGRVSPVGMILPPGYHSDAYAGVRYPVIYFLHGYGQQPEDLIASAVIFQNWMISRQLPESLRIQKLIMVFPDGRCRSPSGTPDHAQECIRGTFYADSVRPEGPQMETNLLELMDYIDANYRTKAAEEVTVTY